MTTMYKLIFLIVAIALLTLGAFAYISLQERDYLGGTMVEVSGTVSYNERIALPSGSVLEVELRDVSRMDIPAVTLSQYEKTTSGENIPLPFSVRYDSSAISETGQYAIFARILVDGQPRWITDTNHAVVLNGEPVKDVEVVLAMTYDSEEGNSATTELSGTAWIWRGTMAADGSTVEPEDDSFVLSFAGSQVMSTTDCNSMSGAYIISGGTISFSAFVSTLMFCEGSLEGPYAATLSTVEQFAIDGEELRLTTGDGSVMLFTKTTPTTPATPSLVPDISVSSM